MLKTPIALLGLMIAPLVAQDRDHVAAARVALEQTRAAHMTAWEALERTYAQFEHEHQDLASGGDGALKRRILERLTPLASTVDELLRDSAAGSDRKAKAATEAWRTAIRPSLAELGVSPGLVEVMIAAMSEVAAEAATFNAGDRRLDFLAQKATDGLGLRRPFHELWNSRLFQIEPAAASYAETYRAFIAAGTELTRMRAPAEYLPGGQKVRPGMVYVPGGAYEIGPNTGWTTTSTVKRKRLVTLRAFLMDKLEVTNSDFLAFFNTLADVSTKRLYLPAHWKLDDALNPVVPNNLLNHPVAGVSWVAAQAYANWCGKRLPTEEEWEAAARGTDGRMFPWGSHFEPGRCNSKEEGKDGTVPVGLYQRGASPMGCIDMAGNVDEWTATSEKGEFLEDVTSSLVSVVIRGGSYLRSADNVSTVFRWIAPGFRAKESNIGFRCAADVK